MRAGGRRRMLGIPAATVGACEQRRDRRASAQRCWFGDRDVERAGGVDAGPIDEFAALFPSTLVLDSPRDLTTACAWLRRRRSTLRLRLPVCLKDRPPSTRMVVDIGAASGARSGSTTRTSRRSRRSAL